MQELLGDELYLGCGRPGYSGWGYRRPSPEQHNAGPVWEEVKSRFGSYLDLPGVLLTNRLIIELATSGWPIPEALKSYDRCVWPLCQQKQPSRLDSISLRSKLYLRGT